MKTWVRNLFIAIVTLFILSIIDNIRDKFQVVQRDLFKIQNVNKKVKAF